MTDTTAGTYQGKRVLVTGAAGVLGVAVAAHFARGGATLALLDVLPIEAEHLNLICDLTDADACVTTVAQAADALGGIDILANIAGGFTMGDSVADTSDATWEFMFDLNARTVFNMARAVVPMMRSQGAGKIVNVGARGGLRGSGLMAAYAASKSVVQRLTEALADELKGDGINVNCVLPSIIDTPRNRTDMPDAKHDAWVAPEDLANVIGFLASDGARAIHGASIAVDGLS
jgi:NAD(P)-dependent dehydrogenase (short-subunit alcohol dehydrogenase family)